MATIPQGRTSYDHPSRLRELLSRAQGLASEHHLSSVLVGLGGFEGDILFPEVVNFVESELRVDDSVFRMTRERAVLLLTDVTVAQAERVIERLLESFREHFPAATEPSVSCGYYEVSGEVSEVTAKEVLPRLFATPPTAH
ncbi:MAG: diguanylate cyclase domain-containing protein [Myxococcota bacterium]